MRASEALDDDGLSGMWKARAKRAEAAIEKLESYCFGLETQVGGFRPPVIRELFSTTKAGPMTDISREERVERSTQVIEGLKEVQVRLGELLSVPGFNRVEEAIEHIEARPGGGEELRETLEFVREQIRSSRAIQREGGANYWLVPDSTMLEITRALTKATDTETK